MSIKRHLTVLFYRERCQRETLTSMLEKLNEQEAHALWRLLQEKEQQANRAKSKANRGW